MVGNTILQLFLGEKQMLKPVKHREFYVPEAPYPFPPIRSGILLGSSGNGKSNLMLSLLMGPYKGLHSRVIIVSPSVHVDPLWQTWKDFVNAHYDWADELDETLFDTYDEPALREIVDKHKKINQEIKRRHKGKKSKVKLFSLLIFFDDMSDDAKLHDSHGLIAEIFLRHRHNFIQAICSSQKWRSISTAVRGQTCWICIFGLRSAEEKKAVLGEISAVYPLKKLEEFYDIATHERFSFLYVNLLAPTKEEMFFKTFMYKMSA